MNFDDFKIPQSNKRNAEEKEEEEEEDLDPEIAERNKLLALIEEDDEETEEFDSSGLKRAMNALQKKIKSNQEMRVKYVDQPERFMDSELELHEEIQNFMILGTAPDLYPEFTASKLFPLVVQLLSHENPDISIAVVNLFHEMSDYDNLTDFIDEGKVLMHALIDANVILLFFQNVARLDEKNKDDSDCIHKTLGVLENFTALEPEIPRELLKENNDLLKWLLKRVRQKGFDQNRLYASELVAIFCKSHTDVQEKMYKVNGIDVLLRALAYYRNKDPKVLEEGELMNNLFDALCACLLYKKNRDKFLAEEGLELMIIMLKEKKSGQVGAIKTLSYCMMGDEPEMCKRFVNQFGLKSFFPKFMKPPKKLLKEHDEMEKFEEYVINIIVSLLRNLKNEEKFRNRILAKFMESDMVKIERLIEFHEKYFEKVQRCREEILQEQKEIEDMGETIEDDEYDLFLLREMDSGLCTLQLVDYLIGVLCTCGVPEFKRHILKLFNQKKKEFEEVIVVLQDYTEDTQKIKEDIANILKQIT